MYYNFNIIQQKQHLRNKLMSQNHFNIEQQFFNSENAQTQLHESNGNNGINQNDKKVFQGTSSSASNLNNHIERHASQTQAKFYEEYKKILTISFNLYEEKMRITTWIQQIKAKLGTIQSKLSNTDRKTKQNYNQNELIKKQQYESQDLKSKRSRRTAQEIQKKYQCNAIKCERYYGSEGSLQQHIKLKHPQIFKKTDDSEEDHSQENQKNIGEGS